MLDTPRYILYPAVGEIEAVVDDDNDLITGSSSNERVQALEQKLLMQQEELTSLHRRRGENTQQILSLNERVHDLEKQLQAKDIL